MALVIDVSNERETCQFKDQLLEILVLFMSRKRKEKEALEIGNRHRWSCWFVVNLKEYLRISLFVDEWIDLTYHYLRKTRPFRFYSSWLE